MPTWISQANLPILSKDNNQIIIIKSAKSHLTYSQIVWSKE